MPAQSDAFVPARMAIMLLAAITLQPDPDNPRKYCDKEELERLGQDMQRRGVLVPLIIRDVVNMVIDGHRRLAAALMVGIEKLPCIVVPEGTTAAQVKSIQLVTSLTKADLNAYERYCGFTDLKALTPGMTNKGLAAELSVSAPLVSMIFTLDKCIPQAKELAEKGLLNLNEWYRLSKLSPERQAEKLAAKLTGANPKGDSESETVRVTRINCDVPGRKKAKLCIAAENLSLSLAVEIAQDWLREAKKAIEQNISAPSFVKVCRDKSKAS